MDRGILYVATGKAYYQEAIISAQSLKKCSPDLPICIVTDQDDDNPLFDTKEKLDDVQHSFRDKVLGMQRSPFKHTLFLDTDTYICKPVDALFQILGRFDIAAAHAPKRRSMGLEDLMQAPATFPELNTGVIAYQQTPDVSLFLTEWLRLYDKFVRIEKERKQQLKGDQPAFREALYQSRLAVNI